MIGPKPEYLEKAKALPEEERGRLLCRMRNKLPLRLEKVWEIEAIAIQMELEDEDLDEWRKNLRLLRARCEEKIFASSMA